MPEVLVDTDRQKMFHELMRDIEKHGISPEQYLADIKKTEKELFEDFRVQAEKRAKAALVSRQVAKDNELAPSKEDIDAEIKLISDMYQNDEKVQEKLKHQEVRDTIATTIQNSNVMSWLKEQLFGKKEDETKEEANA